MPRTRLSIRAAVLASLAIGAAPVAFAASFPTVVRAVLNAQTTGRLAQMDPDQRAQMTDCVIGALAGMPNGRKQYVTGGAGIAEQQHRFGEVVLEDRAKWKQKIASVCASIALAKTTGDK